MLQDGIISNNSDNLSVTFIGIAKVNGEKFQKDLVSLIQEVLPEHKDVIVSSPISAHAKHILAFIG